MLITFYFDFFSLDDHSTNYLEMKIFTNSTKNLTLREITVPKVQEKNDILEKGNDQNKNNDFIKSLYF